MNKKLVQQFTVYTKPISTNQGYAVSHSRLYKKAIAKAYQTEIAKVAQSQFKGQCDLTSKFFLKIEYYFRTSASDIDGPVKFTFDSLEGIFYKNDKQVWDFQVKKNVDSKNPRVVISVYKLYDKPTAKPKKKRTPKSCKKSRGQGVSKN